MERRYGVAAGELGHALEEADSSAITVVEQPSSNEQAALVWNDGTLTHVVSINLMGNIAVWRGVLPR